MNPYVNDHLPNKEGKNQPNARQEVSHPAENSRQQF